MRKWSRYPHDTKLQQQDCYGSEFVCGILDTQLRPVLNFSCCKKTWALTKSWEECLWSHAPDDFEDVWEQVPVGGFTQLLFDDSNTTCLKVTAIAQTILTLLHKLQGLEVWKVSEPNQNSCNEASNHLCTNAHQHPGPSYVSHHCPRQCYRWIVKACKIRLNHQQQRPSYLLLRLLCKILFQSKIWTRLENSSQVLTSLKQPEAWWRQKLL